MLKIIVSFALSVYAFFMGLRGPAMQAGPLPDGGERIHYDSGLCEFMDVYYPEELPERVNVAVLIHGGAWLNGDQTMFTNYAREAASLGYVGVTVGYSDLRYNKTVPQMEDALLKAMVVLDETLRQNGVTPNKLVLIGHSAGAELALLLAYDHYADCPIPIGFVTACSTPADIMLLDGEEDTVIEKNRHLLGTSLSGENMSTLSERKRSDAYIAAEYSISPVLHITPDVPPTLLIHTDRDTMVPYQNSVELYEKLTENGVDTELLTLPGDHFFHPRTDEVLTARRDAILRWAEKYL